MNDDEKGKKLRTWEYYENIKINLIFNIFEGW